FNLALEFLVHHILKALWDKTARNQLVVNPSVVERKNSSDGQPLQKLCTGALRYVPCRLYGNVIERINFTALPLFSILSALPYAFSMAQRYIRAGVFPADPCFKTAGLIIIVPESFVFVHPRATEYDACQFHIFSQISIRNPFKLSLWQFK